MIACSAELASFRDPSGHVFVQNERVFRTVRRCAAADYEFVRDQGLLERLAEEGRLVASAEVDPKLLGPAQNVHYLLEHARRHDYALLTRPEVKLETDERLRLGEFGIQTRLVKPPATQGEAPSQGEQGHTMVYSVPPKQKSRSRRQPAAPVEQWANGPFDPPGDDQQDGAWLAEGDPVPDQRADEALVHGHVPARGHEIGCGLRDAHLITDGRSDAKQHNGGNAAKNPLQPV